MQNIPTPSSSPCPILIVDDIPANIEAMTNLLEDPDLLILSATSGNEALKCVLEQEVAVVLMDVQMPEMDGFETAELMRRSQKTRHIPIIFVTAISREEQHVFQGYEAGAVDYLFKPIDPLILRSKVRVFCDLYRQRKELEHYKNHLENLVEARTCDLLAAQQKLSEHAAAMEKLAQEMAEQAMKMERLAAERAELLVQNDQMAALGALSAGMAHEVKTPLGNALTAISHLLDRTQQLVKKFEAQEMRRSDLVDYLHLAQEAGDIALRNLHRANDLMQSFKTVAVDQSSEARRTFRLRNYLDDILLTLRPELKKTGHRVTIHCPDDLVLYSHPGAFSQIITNFIRNSLLHAFGPGVNGEMTLRIEREGEKVRMEYSDNGCGIPLEILPRIFDRFFTTKRDTGGSGLGLHIVRELVEKKLGGTIVCESVVGKGTTFRIEFPYTAPPETPSPNVVKE